MPAPSTIFSSTKARVLAVAAFVSAGLVVTPPPADAAETTSPPALAYSLLSSSGQVVGLGGAYGADAPTTTRNSTVPAAVADTNDGGGAYVVSTNGALSTSGDATDAGSLAGYHLSSPVVDIVTDPVNSGYWMVSASGGVFAFGGAPFYGSMGGQPLSGPVVGMAATPDGGGYWTVTSTGSVYGFGDAQTFGSLAGVHLGSPIVGMASTPDGQGYWFAAAGGGIFAFGDAGFFGSAAPLHLSQPIIGIVPTADGGGYWLANARGGIFSYGDAPFMGSAAPMQMRFVSVSAGLAASSVVPVQRADSYANPFRAVKLTPMRVDEGVDYGGDGPVYAIGDGVVQSTTGSWPGGGFISYRLINGPAAGKLVYLAENVTPTVSIGQTITPNTVIGIMHNAWPYIETGWAYDHYGDTMAAQSGAWNSTSDGRSLPTAYGLNFNRLLMSLGAPSGDILSSTVVGTLPAAWPAW